MALRFPFKKMQLAVAVICNGFNRLYKRVYQFLCRRTGRRAGYFFQYRKQPDDLLCQRQTLANSSQEYYNVYWKPDKI